MKKIIGIILAVILVIGGNYLGGIIGALFGAAAAAFFLKYFEVVSPTSAWVSETKGVRIAKYVLLAVVLVGVAVFAYVALNQ